MSGVSINLWYEALGARLGVALVPCEGNAEEVRRRLYKLRKESNDPDIDCLSLVQSPTNPQQLWIVKVEK